MKLNLGCGSDIKQGYVNVDLRKLLGIDMVCDLTEFPWSFPDNSAEEVLMLDFFEHVPYRKNGLVLGEVWRVLEPGGTVVIQVPDFDHSVSVIQGKLPFVCNRCEKEIKEGTTLGSNGTGGPACPYCSHDWYDMVQVAMQRLYGGQDYLGNWHFFSYNKMTLKRMLYRHGFRDIELMEKDHQYRQWSLKVSAKKSHDIWGDDE